MFRALTLLYQASLQPSCTACLFHVPLPDSKAVYMAALKVQYKSCGLGNDKS